MRNKLLFVYLDWTLERAPRCFYVGLGDDARLRKRDRNLYWGRIAAKYGWRREAVLASYDPVFIEEQEIEWIVKMKTFHYDNENNWGANFTRGGGGLRGFHHTDETRRKIGLGRRGKKNTVEAVEKCRLRVAGEGNPMFGKKHSELSKAKMRQAQLGRKPSSDSVAKRSGENHPLYGKKHSEERRRKVSGENHFRTELTWEDVSAIRQLWGTRQISQNELARRHNVTKSAIWKIVHNLTWRDPAGSV